ncbi:GNAT family N-acetyltransferase [Halomonas sabkhae]|uniref:GNAT family N-acetyltransferase n=1 Tax=Halomonas sabkhae TaxID=626223 RepID=UPI0025B3D9D8|nr:GNAT family N-acetyltransferase [Halomonas sabkhae]MDN3524672.1 GNAT family N-acetyltransferase [Halomonas sabkhae]
MPLKIDEGPPSEVPMDLLLLADPSEDAVKEYLNQSRCFVAYANDVVVGSCVLKPIEGGVVELMNIAVSPSNQRSGIGTRLLRNVIDKVKESGARGLEVGTGTFGYQLTFYQRQGFRVDRIDKRFFLRNYPEPIVEDGVQQKDMLRLTLEFCGEILHQRTV